MLADTAKETVARLAARRWTCATAESCTGGGVGRAITSVAGASAVFMGGVISYANAVKTALLGVDPETLTTVGAVSPETAAQMARGARERLGVDVAVSVTGIAGPDGGSAEKPVGLVYVGCADARGVRVERLQLTGSRERIRNLAALRALDMIRRAAMGY